MSYPFLILMFLEMELAVHISFNVLSKTHFPRPLGLENYSIGLGISSTDDDVDQENMSKNTTFFNK